MRDTLLRSIVKSVTWRVIGIILLGGISWIATHDFYASMGITALFNAIRVVGFVIHERLWERTNWGRNGCPRCGWPDVVPCSESHHYEWLLCPDQSEASIEVCDRCGRESGRRRDAPS